MRLLFALTDLKAWWQHLRAIDPGSVTIDEERRYDFEVRYRG